MERDSAGSPSKAAIPQWFYDSWLPSISEADRSRVEELVLRLRSLGDSVPEMGAYSEIVEDIPQLSRLAIIRRLWTVAINRYRDDASWIRAIIEQAPGSEDQFAVDTGSALQRMFDCGVSQEDVRQVARAVAYEAVFSAVEIVDEGCSPEIEGVGWALMELNREGVATGRQIAALHEDILTGEQLLDTPAQSSAAEERQTGE